MNDHACARVSALSEFPIKYNRSQLDGPKDTNCPVLGCTMKQRYSISASDTVERSMVVNSIKLSKEFSQFPSRSRLINDFGNDNVLLAALEGFAGL